MLITRKLNREKVMAHKPAHIGTVANVKFYEHPLLGDEAPLIADTGAEIGVSVFWDMPTIDELLSA